MVRGSRASVGKANGSGVISRSLLGPFPFPIWRSFSGLSLLSLVPVPVSCVCMPSTLARYEAFLVKNVSVISTLESSLRSITWILPGRFKDAELASEARQLSCLRIYVVC